MSARPPDAPIGPFIDAHHHLWDPAVRRQGWLEEPGRQTLHRRFDVVDLDTAAAGTSVRATVLVQVLHDEDETREFLATAAGTGGGQGGGNSGIRIAGVVGWVDLTAPDVTDRLAALQAGPGGDRLVGIRHLAEAEADPEWLVRPEVLRGLRAVAAAGLVYDLLVRTAQLPAAAAAVRAVPEGRYVLDHLAKPPIATGGAAPGRGDDGWLAGIGVLAGEPSVAVKLSGMVTEADHGRWTVADLAPWADAVIDLFGPARTMFGSDWPVCLLAASYSQVVQAWRELTRALAPDELSEAAGGTAQRWYGLDT